MHCLALAASAVSLSLPKGSVKQSGPSVDVWSAAGTLHRCGKVDVPDIPARAFVDNEAKLKTPTSA